MTLNHDGETLEHDSPACRIRYRTLVAVVVTLKGDSPTRRVRGRTLHGANARQRSRHVGGSNDRLHVVAAPSEPRALNDPDARCLIRHVGVSSASGGSCSTSCPSHRGNDRKSALLPTSRPSRRNPARSARYHIGKPAALLRQVFGPSSASVTSVYPIGASYPNTASPTLDLGLTLQHHLNPSLVDLISRGHQTRLHRLSTAFTIPIGRLTVKKSQVEGTFRTSSTSTPKTLTFRRLVKRTHQATLLKHKTVICNSI